MTLLVGYQKSIWPVKSWVMRRWHGCLFGARCKWLHKAQLMPLPSSSPAWLKSRMVFAFLVLAYPGYCAKEAVKQAFVLKANKSECPNTTKCNIQTMPHFITFCTRHSRGKMYVRHSRLYYVSVPRHIPTLLNTPGCNLGEWKGVPSSCVYWVDLQSVHWFDCYNNTVPNAKCQQLLELARWLVHHS